MLEDPKIPPSLILSCLQEDYGLAVSQVSFLPLGYDLRSAVYRVETRSGRPYFLKLRNGKFDPMMVTLPHYLYHHGIPGIITPLETRSRKLYGQLDQYTMILYPFIDGKDGYQTNLSDHQWFTLGKILRRVHDVQLSKDIVQQIQVESYSPSWRELVYGFLVQVEQDQFDDPIAVKLAAFIQSHSETINLIVCRAGELAESLKRQSINFILCHNDVHPGNYLVADNGELYLVDWDDPILAPRERDLIFFEPETGDTSLVGCSGSLFYQGYGQVEINFTAMAYFRYERIIVDIAEFCQQILQSRTGDEDCQQAYLYFTASFLPGHDVERAFKTDQLARSKL